MRRTAAPLRGETAPGYFVPIDRFAVAVGVSAIRRGPDG